MRYCHKSVMTAADMENVFAPSGKAEFLSENLSLLYRSVVLKQFSVWSEKACIS
jgi:hypothetical protein